MLALSVKCGGVILLLVAVAGAAASVRRGWRARVITVACVALIILVPALAIVPAAPEAASISRLVVLALAVTLVCTLPDLAETLAQFRYGAEIDLAYVLYAAGELALAAYAFRMGTGTWHNHVVQGAIFGAVLAARAVAKSAQRPLPARAALIVAMAALAVPAIALADAYQVVSSRRAECSSIDQMLRRLGVTRATIFFVDRPGLNRLHGRTDLVYDPWLYPVFESIALAEPRSVWLARALRAARSTSWSRVLHRRKSVACLDPCRSLDTRCNGASVLGSSGDGGKRTVRSDWHEANPGTRPGNRASPERELALALTLGEILEDFLYVARDAPGEHSGGRLWNREEGAQFTFDATTHIRYFE